MKQGWVAGPQWRQRGADAVSFRKDTFYSVKKLTVAIKTSGIGFQSNGTSSYESHGLGDSCRGGEC